jgi:multicomponent Na+:H+ antiporter subunit E
VITFLWNVVLAFLWAAVMDEVTFVNLAIGFVLGLVLLAFVTPHPGVSPYALKMLYVLRLLGIVTWDVVVANLRIAYEILTPTMHNLPAVYAYEMEARTDAEVTLLALLITFTPGTLMLEASEDGRVLYVHMMFSTPREEFTRSVRERLERPLLQVLR